jgi:hypothetical protein
MARGTRNVGMLEQMGYGRGRKALPTPPTPEQQAAGRALQVEFLRNMAINGGVPPDEADQWAEERAA